MSAIELEGGAAIKVCPMPDAALTVESRTLAAPARPPAAEKDDIDSYNAKMLNIMQAAFKKVVQAKSGAMVEVTPAEGTCASLPFSVRKSASRSALTLQRAWAGDASKRSFGTAGRCASSPACPRVIVPRRPC